MGQARGGKENRPEEKKQRSEREKPGFSCEKEIDVMRSGELHIGRHVFGEIGSCLRAELGIAHAGYGIFPDHFKGDVLVDAADVVGTLGDAVVVDHPAAMNILVGEKGCRNRNRERD